MPAILGAAGLVLAAAVNSGLLVLEHRRRALTRLAGPRAWYLHLGVAGLAWAGALALLARAGRRVRWPLRHPAARIGGVAAAAAGLGLVVAGARQLGPAAVLNGQFFGRASPAPVHSGVYAVLRHPMYDGFALLVAAAGLLSGNALYLAYAAECWVVCRFIEVPVEDQVLAP